jgi:hypothetical protein
MDKLREEILQAEQTRSDLLKLKLSLVGAIGALGLGFSGSGTFGHAELVLALVPLVCVYVDLLCRHLTLRIVVIGAFLRTSMYGGRSGVDAFQAYEVFVQNQRWEEPGDGPRGGRRRVSPFDLEDWALEYSTYLLSVGIFLFGVLYALRAVKPAFSILFLLSGLVGMTATWLGRREYNKRCELMAAVQSLSTSVPTQLAGSP